MNKYDLNMKKSWIVRNSKVNKCPELTAKFLGARRGGGLWRAGIELEGRWVEQGECSIQNGRYIWCAV